MLEFSSPMDANAAPLPEQLTSTLAVANAKCYWPGPWTLDSDRKDQLIGRATDIDELMYVIRDTRLTVISGDSGVGKSSLILAGLIPALRDDGYKALVCRDWRDDRTAAQRDRRLDGLSHFLAAKLQGDMELCGISVDDPDNLAMQLNESFGSEVVLIFDQFEEVIRQQPQLFADLCEWMEEVVVSTRLRVVISLRSEYAHYLSDLKVGQYRRQDRTIPPIQDPSDVRKILFSGRFPDAGASGNRSPVVDEDAVDEILRVWSQAGADQRRSRVRLLHLQSLLYALWAQCRPGERIDRTALLDFLEGAKSKAHEYLERKYVQSRAVTGADRELAIGVFEWAVSHVVRIHVEMCAESFDRLREQYLNDVPLAEGVRSSLVRLAEHLSSGGYKIDQEETLLVMLVLSDELRTLGFYDETDNTNRPEELARAIVGEMAVLTRSPDYDWLRAPTWALEARVAAAVLHRLRGDAPDMDVGESAIPARGNRNVGAGALFDASAERVLVEECRRVFLALHWLQAGNIIRFSPADGGRNFVALSHDGFGRGLNEWADENDNRPQVALNSLTAAIGRVFDWPVTRLHDAANPLFGAPHEEPRLYVNLRWRACRIVGTRANRVIIQNVVFMNCDLRGTSFRHCIIQGVTFINCLLDGVQFEDCVVNGRAAELERATRAKTDARQLPSFLWEDPYNLLAVLRHYQEDVIDGADHIFSKTSGESVRGAALVGTDHLGPLVLVEEERPPQRVTGTAPHQSGGLVMFGGRLSSLAFYRCDFSTDPVVAEVSLRHVAGISLDFFEHEGGRVELYDVAIRGVTISPPLTASLEGREPVHVEFEAVASHLENVWFSAGLRGTAELRNSVVWQLFNGSYGLHGTGGDDHGWFKVTLDEDCHYLGITNVRAEDNVGKPMFEVNPHGVETGFIDEVRSFAARIDYRSPSENLRYESSLGASPELIEDLEEQIEREDHDDM